ncbi:MAG: DUF2892 domain-containing protein [Candidatus Pacebacteria bacterium]|nr:DUF2892 domain-containing protein [Candidatus Paceibacterota bacterium]
MSPLQKTHITVGTVILLSLTAYWYFDIWYPLIFPTLIGAGLVRAGVTGNCPMTNLFARYTTCKKA